MFFNFFVFWNQKESQDQIKNKSNKSITGLSIKNNRTKKNYLSKSIKSTKRKAKTC